jgi:hypothetical protein
VRRAILAGAFLTAALLQWPLLRADPLLTRDDQTLVQPLATIDSPRAWVEALQSGRVLDVQPVRDLTFAANLALARATGQGFFHATNVLLWLVACALLARLLGSLDGRGWRSTGLAALFALHPAFAMATSWVAARKHLLALVFVLAATLTFRRLVHHGARWGAAAATVAFFLLSVFSQPIGVLWPLWAGFEARRALRRSEVRVTLVLLGVVLLAAASINFSYYSHGYVADTGQEKFVAGFHPGISLLALGRAAFNLLCPVVLATMYSPGSVVNLAGLGLLVLLGVWMRRAAVGVEGLSWAAFALLPLAVVLGKMTSIFLFDTYLLIPGVGLSCLLVLATKSLEGTRAGAALVTSLLVAFAVLNAGVVSTWRSDEALWEHAWTVEPTPRALGRKAHYLAGTARGTEAIDAALELQELDPESPEWPGLLARAILKEPTLSPEQKLVVLEKVPVNEPWGHYARGAAWAVAGDAARATERFFVALEHPEAFRAQVSVVAAEAHALCGQAGRADCDERLATWRRLPEWSEQAFTERRAQLGGR